MRANLSPYSLISAYQPRKDTETIFKSSVSHYQTNQIIKAYQTGQPAKLLTCNKSFDLIHETKAKSREIYIILEIFS